MATGLNKATLQIGGQGLDPIEDKRRRRDGGAENGRTRGRGAPTRGTNQKVEMTHLDLHNVTG